MPNKPIKQGYKIFALAEHGYIWTFSWSRRQLGIEEMFKWPGLTPTGSMVVELIERLPSLPSNPLSNPPLSNPPLNSLSNPPSNPPLSNESISQPGLELTISSPVASYSIYMDNYFNSVALFNHLYDCQYGACGTARPTSGIHPLPQELRDHAKGLPWGTLYALRVSNVLCLAWQDNNIVLCLSTLHSADSFVACRRKRPGKTSTNGTIARRVFGEEVIKELEIPIFINDYNHYMNGVDLANQSRSSYEVHLKGYRNWLLFYTSSSMLLLSMPGAFNISISSSMEPLAYPPSYSSVRSFTSNSLNLQETSIPVYQFSVLILVKIINEFN
jgi:hypothetical protein